MLAKNRSQVSSEQLELIERFINAYNKIDHYLRNQLKEDPGTSFLQLVYKYASQNPRWNGQATLRVMSEVRNGLVHQREHKNEYLSVPLPGVVAELEQIRDNLISPVLVYPKLHREVQSFQSEVSLSEVLKSIYEKGYSQFPIYQEGEYVGLLTENGITRWLASHNAKVMTLIEFEDVPIKDVLSNEEQRKNCRFIRRDTPLPEAENHFVQHATLEALLITDKGNASENLLGIITRWDILEL